ncbi:MAG: T9SS C-terminal target domain-containing protein, partial [Ignavibacteria bacterium]
ITDSTHLTIQNLAYNTLYEWNARAFNSMGDSSALSPTYSFITLLNRPIPIQPMAGTELSDSTVNFIWSSVDGGDFYNLRVSKDSTFNQTLDLDTLVYDTTFSWTFPPGKYFWKVQALGNNFNYSYYSDTQSFVILLTGVDNNFNLPTEYSLTQNYPNPFNPETTIKFDIPATETGLKEQSVKIIIYDVLGRKVKTLVNEIFKPGRYSIVFHPQGLSSGIYYYKMTCGNYSNVKKMILLK